MHQECACIVRVVFDAQRVVAGDGATRAKEPPVIPREEAKAIAEGVDDVAVGLDRRADPVREQERDALVEESEEVLAGIEAAKPDAKAAAADLRALIRRGFHTAK